MYLNKNKRIKFYETSQAKVKPEVFSPLNRLTFAVDTLTTTVGSSIVGGMASHFMHKAPLVGMCAGAAVGGLGSTIDAYLKKNVPVLRDRDFTRIPISHVTAGTLVYAIAALALAAGITAATISLPEIATITISAVATQMIAKLGTEACQVVKKNIEQTILDWRKERKANLAKVADDLKKQKSIKTLERRLEIAEKNVSNCNGKNVVRKNRLIAHRDKLNEELSKLQQNV